MKLLHKSGLGILLAVVSVTANAGEIASGTVYNNTGGEFNASYAVERMTDQSGLSDTYVSGVTDFQTFVTSGVTHVTQEGQGGVAWLSDGIGGLPFVVDFDLGSEFQINAVAIWNGAAGNDASINSFDIFTSDTDDFAVSTLVGSFNNPIGVDGPEPVNVFNLTQSTSQYIRLQINTTYGNTCCAVIGEIAFDLDASSAPPTAPVAVPTLSAYGIVLAILAMIFLAGRRLTPAVRKG